jgi:nucleotide-binding universal stress UspA family protein
MKVLIPLDGSELARAVVPHVRALFGANTGGGPEIHLLAVVDPEKAAGKVDWARAGGLPAAAGSIMLAAQYPRLVESHGQALERVHGETEESLNVLAREAFPGQAVSCHVEWSERPVEEIVRVANDLGVDVIAMATHGRSGVSHLVAGSITEGVIRKSGKPVLVYRPADSA